MARVFFSRIYYQTIKDIYPGQELLVDYGDIYAKSLGLFEELELSDVSKAKQKQNPINLWKITGIIPM